MMLSAEAAQALRTVYGELFWLAGRLRAGDIPGHRTVDIRTWAAGQLRQHRRSLLRADVDDSIINDAELAVIALLDESAQLSSARDCAEQWMSRLLQYEQYKHSNLGRDFFDRLEALRQRPDTPPPLIEIFARCLSWGFEGRYREENRLDDLRVLRDALRADLLHRLAKPPLCPPLSELSAPPPLAPLFGAPWVVGLGAALLLFIGVVLTGILSWRANVTASTIHELATGSAEADKSQSPNAAE